MNRTRAAWSLMLMTACVAASAAGPADVPDGCASALQGLDAARRGEVAPARVESLRRAAAEACLGAPAGARPGTRGLAPPVAVTPVSPGLPAAPAGVRGPAMPSEPLSIGRPSMVGNCDATGCWDAQGQRLNRMGDGLIGPRGNCIAQGAGFVCP